MRSNRGILMALTLVAVVGLLSSGCAVNLYKQSPRSKQQIQELQTKIDDLEAQRRQEQLEFEDAKRMMEKKLSQQLRDEQISFRLDEAGLAIILSGDILFDSGKADIKPGAYPVLDKLINIISDKVPGKNIGITGHTDNVPIKFSSWKSNWELSSARATNVLYYLESKGVSPDRLSAIGQGEYKPIASNETAKGRAMNRRVEIVILPEFEEQREDIIEQQKDPAVK
jgi:chemotaxis protein MotB